eukprot:PhF_6_TR25798/c0_g1_i2/m.36405
MRLDDRGQDTCFLCNVHVGGRKENRAPNLRTRWQVHCTNGCHRMGAVLLTILIRSYSGRHYKDIEDEWMYAVFHHSAFSGCFIPSLVSVDSIETCKLHFLASIRLLKEHGVLKNSLGNRCKEFNQVEWIGDLSMPPLIDEVIASLFNCENQTRDSVFPFLGHYVGFFCGNPHLERTFDFIGLAEVSEC